MGALFMYKKDIPVDLDSAYDIFQKKDFKNYKDFKLGDWNARIYKKQFILENNWREKGDYLLLVNGTPVYKGYSYSKSLDAIINDLSNNSFNENKMYGFYFMLFWNKNKKKFNILHDSMFQYPVYIYEEGNILSTSFLALTASIDKGININMNSLIEKLCTGFICGTDTLFKEVSKLGYNGGKPLINNKYFIDITKDTYICKRKINSESRIKNAKIQIDFLKKQIKSMDKNIKKYGANIGLSGGYDSRLLLSLLTPKYKKYISAHSHLTVKSHQKDFNIAKKMAESEDVNFIYKKTVPFSEQTGYEMEKTIKENIYYFDGQNDNTYGTFNCTYNKVYRKTVSSGYNVFFTGLSGEIYRNYRKISKPLILDWFINTHICYINHEKMFKGENYLKDFKKNMKNKYFHILDMNPKNIVSSRWIKEFYGQIRFPHKASCAAGAHNQLALYDAPFAHKLSLENSYKSLNVIGDDAELEEEMLRYSNKKLSSLPMTKGFKNKGKRLFYTKILNWFYARLPMPIVKLRIKMKYNYNKNNVPYILKNCNWLAESFEYVQKNCPNLRLDILLNQSSSYKNLLYTCGVLYLLRENINWNNE
ncbi:MAG: hypothetical protein ACOCRK_02335 [bacterium]